MGIIADIKDGLKIVNAIKEVKSFLDNTNLKDIKEDIEIIKSAVERLGNQIKVIATLAELIKKKVLKK